MSLRANTPLIRNLGRFIALTDDGAIYLDGLLSDRIELRPRRKLVDEGRPCERFFIVISGWLAEYRQLRDGRRQILNFRLPGEVLGIESLLYQLALHSVTSLTNCTIAALTRKNFEEMQQRFPRLAAAFLLSRLSDNAILHEWAVNLGRRPAFPRVAHLLLELERRLRLADESAGNSIPFPLTQQDIADCTGLTPPYVNRILQDMRKRGLIQCGENSLEIRDSAALAHAAGFRPQYLQVAPQTEWQSRLPPKLNGMNPIQPPALFDTHEIYSDG